MSRLNCKQMVQMMPLYVAGDLVGGRSNGVVEHLSACESCHRLAEEFSESSSLLAQACTAPEFGEEFYSGIRRAVLGKIRSDQTRARPPLFCRRWHYATALAALVIALGVLLQHFRSSGRETPLGLAVGPRVAGSSAFGQAKRTNPSSSSQLSPPGLPAAGLRSHKDLLINRQRDSPQLERSGKLDATDTAQTAADNTKQVAKAIPLSTYESKRLSPGALATVSAGSALSASGRASASQVSRIEIQTADPNIRIIWLVPRESAESEETDQDQVENGTRK